MEDTNLVNTSHENSNKSKNAQNDLDNYLKHFGWVQISLVFLVNSAKHILGIQVALPNFSLHHQDYKCDTSCLQNQTRPELIYPTKTDSCGVQHYDFCKVNIDNLNTTSECKNIISTESGDCKNFIFDTSGFYKKTFTSEFNIICDNKVLGDWIKASFFVSIILSNFLNSALADKYGRRPVQIMNSIGIILATYFSANAWSPASYTLARMLGSFFFFGHSLMIYTLSIELVGPSARTKANFIYSCIYASGLILASYPLSRFYRDFVPGFNGIVFGGFSLIAAWFSWKLPETLGKDLPLTVEEAEIRYQQ